MINIETVEIDGIQYKRTYSDTYTITRDGVEYTEAIDPYGSDRVYEETENKLEVDESDVEEVVQVSPSEDEESGEETS